MWVAFGLDLKKWYAFPWEASKVGDMGRENVTRKALSAWCLKFSLGWGISNAWSRYTGQDMAVGRGRLELPGKYDLGEGSWEDGSWRRNTQGNKRQQDLGRNKGREEAEVPRRLHDREGNEPLRESSGRGWEKGEMAGRGSVDPGKDIGWDSKWRCWSTVLPCFKYTIQVAYETRP